MVFLSDANKQALKAGATSFIDFFIWYGGKKELFSRHYFNDNTTILCGNKCFQEIGVYSNNLKNITFYTRWYDSLAYCNKSKLYKSFSFMGEKRFDNRSYMYTDKIKLNKEF